MNNMHFQSRSHLPTLLIVGQLGTMTADKMVVADDHTRHRGRRADI
jgi:hypothetical protein